jgi:POT family proton-dependent oligopeptide transporter
MLHWPLDLSMTTTPPDAQPSQAQYDTRFFGHPRGLATLFFTEMWERFSYYGMRAILIFYMTDKIVKGGLGFNDDKAGAVYGLYTAMVYLLCLGGGWVADRIVGQQRAVLLGGLFIAGGEFCLMGPSQGAFYLALVLLMVGTGLLKGNVSTIVGQLYRQGDPRRDSGFSIFYMGINIGALISPIFCGWVGERISWRLGFGLAGLGMLAGLIQYVLGGKYLGDAGLRPASTGDAAKDARQRRNALWALGAGLAVFAALGVLGATGVIAFTVALISDSLGWALLGIPVVVFTWLIFSHTWTAEERKRSAAILVLFVASAVFWASFEQAGSSLSLFAERSTDRHIFGFEFPASWFQFVQPIFVIAAGPGVRVALDGAESPPRRAFQPGQVFDGPALGGPGAGHPGARFHDGGARRAGIVVVAHRHILHADHRRAVPEPGGVERHDQAGARARSRFHDGDLVPLDQHRQLAGGQSRVAL